MVVLRSITYAMRVARTSIVSLRQFSCTTAVYSENKGRLFTRKHEWIAVDGDVGTIGISHYAQDALGELVFVQLPSAGTKVSVGDECGALESVKAAGEVYTPVSGTITEKNSTVEATPKLINESCYDKGWLFKVKLSNKEEVEGLMDQKAYEEFLTIKE